MSANEMAIAAANGTTPARKTAGAKPNATGTVSAAVSVQVQEKLALYLTQHEMVAKHFSIVKFSGWRESKKEGQEGCAWGNIQFQTMGWSGSIGVWKNANGFVSLMPSSRIDRETKETKKFNGLNLPAFVEGLGNEYWSLNDDAWALALRVKNVL